MPRLLDWVITRHTLLGIDPAKYQDYDFLGKDQCFFMGHGYVVDSPKFLSGEYIHTSPLQRMKFIENEGTLRLHTLNSIYDCCLRDCNFTMQTPLAELPFPLKEYAEKYMFGAWGEPKRDSILLVFADTKETGFVAAWVNYRGKNYRLDDNLHAGMFTDSVIVQFPYPSDIRSKKLRGIDIRFYPFANICSSVIQFYLFKSGGFPVYIHNAGTRTLGFEPEKERIMVEPGQRVLVEVGTKKSK